MSNKYLLEIGTEELPYKFIPSAIKQLEANFRAFFNENKVGFGDIKVYATPRRLTLIVEDLKTTQPDEEKILRGPIKKVAYDEQGNLTQAGKGFLKKNGVDEKDAFIKDDYLHAKLFIKGKDVKELLQINIPKQIFKLQGSHFMRWNTHDEKFSRPIRWIVSLLNDEELPIEILNVKSSKVSRGHRFSKTSVEINNVDEYFDKLKDANVIVNQDERRELIISLTEKKAAEIGAKAYYTDDLLEEVTYICEYPVPVVCDFDEKYLEVPEKVTVTVMAVHQRYFALYKNNKLINKFITIANYVGTDFSNIKAGNERVIIARLDDAIFFFNEDTKKPFVDYVENLKGVTFQKGLGTVYDKTQRIREIAKNISTSIGYTSDTIDRTALLCKADLTTSLVFEFTELQGYIGSDYAKKFNEDEKVVAGIKEHYFPLSADSELAETKEGQIVGIADKIDTVSAVFHGGKIPTGSSDPLGVRRAALGIIKTIINKKLNINLSELIKLTLNNFDNVKPETERKLCEFFVQRLIIFLSDNYKKDILEACANSKNPLDNLCDYVERVELLTELVKDKAFAPVIESSNRISKIVKAFDCTSVDKNLFKDDAEKALYVEIEKHVLNKSMDYKTLVEALKEINPAIENFFEHVLVMDNDEKVKNNRLSMLNILKTSYESLADFTTLQI